MSVDRKDKSQKLVNTLVGFLQDKNEEDLIGEVSSQLDKLSLKKGAQGTTIIATSAIKLDEASKKDIQNFFREILNKQYPVKNIVDKSTIGGVKLEWGDLYLDLTLSGRLSSLKRQLAV